jgi:hypothetical protein
MKVRLQVADAEGGGVEQAGPGLREARTGTACGLECPIEQPSSRILRLIQTIRLQRAEHYGSWSRGTAQFGLRPSLCRTALRRPPGGVRLLQLHDPGSCHVVRQRGMVSERILIIALLSFLCGLALVAQSEPAIVPWQAQFQAVSGDLWPWRAAQVKAESGFRLDAQSPVGALGPAQFMPGTWSWCQRQGWVQPNDLPTDLLPALTAQHRYMSWLHPRAGYSKPASNGAYNAGLGNIQRAQAHAKALGLQGQDAWLRALPAITKGHAKETQGYVARIARFELEIRAQLGGHP